VLNAAYAAHPERFVRKPPAPPALPTAAWINKPEEDTLGTTNPRSTCLTDVDSFRGRGAGAAADERTHQGLVPALRPEGLPVRGA
jgi:hypothetical protein